LALLLSREGADHPITFYAESVAGRAACETGEFAIGQQWLGLALAGRQRAFKPGHWLIANTQVLLGACQLYSGALKTAETNLLAGVAVLQTQRGAAFDKTQDGFRYLALLYDKLGRREDAASWRARLNK
jgi:hypothetical protein